MEDDCEAVAERSQVSRYGYTEYLVTSRQLNLASISLQSSGAK